MLHTVARSIASKLHFEGVGLLMVVEMALIGERGIAPRVRASIRLLACVQSQMSLEVALLVECRVAALIWADEVAHSLVPFQVDV